MSLATGGLERSSFLPQLPTIAESGFPGFQVLSWMAVLAPRGTPPAVVEKISVDLNKATQSKAYKDGMAQRGSESLSSTPQELEKRIRSQYDSTGALVKSLGIKH